MLETLAYVSSQFNGLKLFLKFYRFHYSHTMGLSLVQFPLLLWLLSSFLAQRNSWFWKLSICCSFYWFWILSILIPWFQVPVTGEYWNQKQVIWAFYHHVRWENYWSAEGWGTGNKGPCKTLVPQSLAGSMQGLQLLGQQVEKKKVGMGEIYIAFLIPGAQKTTSWMPCILQRLT